MESCKPWLNSKRKPRISTPVIGSVSRSALRNKTSVCPLSRKLLHQIPLLLLLNLLLNQLRPTLGLLLRPPVQNLISQRKPQSHTPQNWILLEIWIPMANLPSRNNNAGLTMTYVCSVVRKVTRFRIVFWGKMRLRLGPSLYCCFYFYFFYPRGKTPLWSWKNSEQFTYSSTEGGLCGDPLCWGDCISLCGQISHFKFFLYSCLCSTFSKPFFWFSPWLWFFTLFYWWTFCLF